jgi:hypothetical protein
MFTTPYIPYYWLGFAHARLADRARDDATRLAQCQSAGRYFLMVDDEIVRKDPFKTRKINSLAKQCGLDDVSQRFNVD